GHLISDQGVAFAGGAAPLQVRFVLVTEITQGCQDRVRRGFSQPTETALSNLPCQLFQLVQMMPLRFSSTEALQNIDHPFGSDPAEGAFAGGLVLSELEEVTSDVYHAVRIVQHD